MRFNFSPADHRRCLTLIALLVLGLLCSSSFPQAPRREKPKLKDFGSSLRKLKWDPEKNQAVNTTLPGSHGSSDEDVISIETSLVVCDVLVTDKQGRPQRNLKQTDFAIAEDGVPQQVGIFTLGDSVNLSRSIVLIIDYSQSQFPYIAESIEAAKILIDKLGPYDQMAIVTDDVELLVNFTTNKRELKRALDSLIEKNRGSKGVLGMGRRRRQFGRSAQFSALLATLNEAFDSEDETPVIVLQTDGDQIEYLRNSIIHYEVPPGLSPELRAEIQEQIEEKKRFQRAGMTEFSLDDVYRAVEKSRATIYTIIPRLSLIGLPEDEQIRRLSAEDQKEVSTWIEATSSAKLKTILQQRQDERQEKFTKEIWDARLDHELKIQQALIDVAKLSGGWADFLETGSQPAQIYNRIVRDLNQRYIIGYYPTNKEHDGKRRRISVTVKGHPDFVITGRTSYYAPDH